MKTSLWVVSFLVNAKLAVADWPDWPFCCRQFLLSSPILEVGDDADENDDDSSFNFSSSCLNETRSVYTYANETELIDYGNRYDPTRYPRNPHCLAQCLLNPVMQGHPWWLALVTSCRENECEYLDVHEYLDCCTKVEYSLSEVHEYFEELCNEAGGKTILHNVSISCMEGTNGCRGYLGICLNADLVGYPTCVGKSCDALEALSLAIFEVSKFGHSDGSCCIRSTESSWRSICRAPPESPSQSLWPTFSEMPTKVETIEPTSKSVTKKSTPKSGAVLFYSITLSLFLFRQT